VFRVVFGTVVLLKVGYEAGMADSKDVALQERKVVEFDTEEQIFDALFNKDKMAVFLQLYIPGQKRFDDFNTVFE